MSHNRSIFFEALDRSEARRDGGYKQNWSFSLSDDSEEERRHDTSVVTMEEVDRQQQSSPDGNKVQWRPLITPSSRELFIPSPTLRHFTSSDPLRTYENRPNNHSRSLNKLGPGRRLSEISHTVATPSPMPNRTNYFIVSPPSQGVVLQGRPFQHTHITPAVRKHVQSNLDLKERNDCLTTQQIPPVQLDSIVLTCPEISDDENLNIKRRVQQKRRLSQESCCSYPSPVKPVEPLHSDGHLTMCSKCNKPSEDHTKCHNCGNVLAPVSFQHAYQPQLSSPAARPPIRSQPSTGPNNLQLNKNFYSPTSAVRAPRMEIVPVRITKTSFLPLHNGRPGTGPSAGTSSCCGSRISTKGKRTAVAKQHELNDPIVLSSDEDEEADTASTGSVNRLDSVSPRPADSAHSSPAPSGGRVEAAVKSTGEQEITSDFFSDVDAKISLPRKPRMKDPFGKPVPESFSPKIKKPKVSSAKCDSIILECRSIRVGTLRRMVTKPVIFSIEQIQLETEAPQQNAMEDVSLRASELISCEWCSVRKLPVLFFQTTQAECLRLRTQLNMSQEKGNMWYDCAGNQSDEKYIVLIFENGLTMKDQMILEDILKEIGQTNNLEDFPTKLSFDEANSRLVNYNKATKEKEEKRKPLPFKITQVSPVKSVLPVTPTTKVAQVTQVSPVSPVLLRTRMATRQHSSAFLNDEDDDMAELPPTFTGPIIKLMVYPPPPAKGGITVTNEDLHCLTEGEFLNDVIIDFYLKYLVLEKLKKEDAQRSHVFSSFFYKRLNQREKRPVPDTAILPIQRRKHNRVRTWTRHVDLFQKDFIFVPINESAHWYLAVICFPGLQGPQYEENSMYQGQTLAPGPVSGAEPALGPPMDESFPDHCRPISPDIDDALGPQQHLSPSGTSSEGHSSTERPNVSSACASELQEPSYAPKSKINAQGESLPQYTNGLHRISLSYGSGNDDSCTFPDDQSSCQDECSEDGALADETLSPDSSGWASKPTLCKQPCILIMDSLRGPGRSAVVKTLREYLEVEWETRKGSQRTFGKEVMKGSNPRVPQQDNFSDCGVYILQYVESFFENPIPSFQLPVNLTEWFPQQRMKTKREEIKELILQLQTQQEVDKMEADKGRGSCSPGEPEIEETYGSGVQNLPVSP
ncbi:sentrin-specific protease 6 [Aplochiton taeniatus]